MSEANPEVNVENPTGDDISSVREAIPRKRRSPLRRLGCGVALIIWFVLMLTPCLLIVLATQGQITILLSGGPEREFRIWMVMESDRRGFGIANPSLHEDPKNDAVCVQTDVRFALWMGEGKPASYCECFQHSSSDGNWHSINTRQGNCEP
jgi:hypothetical protein